MGLNAFRWAVGIEDTFIGHPHPRTGRVLDEYELIDHYRRWRTDLQLVADIGIRTMRFGIPWYLVEPAPGRFEWRWTDAVLEHLVAQLGITPILDLVHYGTPLWLDRSFANAEYAARVATYAYAVADRYGNLISWYTPLNEPVVNAIFCGRNGVWPPGLRGERGFTRILLALAEGIAATIDALRAAQGDAVIVHVEAADWQSTDDPTLAEAVAWTQTLHALSAELVTGKVVPGHPAWAWLVQHGADVGTLERLHSHPQRIDIMGVNFYPHLSRGHLQRSDAGVRRRRRYGSGADLSALLQSVHARFGLPMMVTETSDNASVARRARWMRESVEGVRLARSAGANVIGYTWWPAFSLVGWNWRGGRREQDAYWCHMGLWDIANAASLERVPTPLVDQYARIVAAGDAQVGSVGKVPA